MSFEDKIEEMYSVYKSKHLLPLEEKIKIAKETTSSSYSFCTKYFEFFDWMFEVDDTLKMPFEGISFFAFEKILFLIDDKEWEQVICRIGDDIYNQNYSKFRKTSLMTIIDKVTMVKK